MAKLLLFVAAACFLALVASEDIEFKDCGSKKGKVMKINVSPCPKQPCQLKQGSEYTVQVTFSPAENVTKATTVVYGVVSSIKLPFPLPNSNACIKNQGLTCPLAAGGTFVFKTALPIKSFYPKISVVVMWQLKDQNGDLVYCWETPIEIVG